MTPMTTSKALVCRFTSHWLSSMILLSLALSLSHSGVTAFHAPNVVPTATRSSIAQTSSCLALARDNNSAPPLKRNPPRKICLMVEPTPFTHVSGYANRFKEMLKFMSKAGDQVDILTVDSKTPASDLPKSAFGFKIHHTQGFTFPLYNQISLTLDLPEMKGARMIEKFKPDLIHVTSPYVLSIFTRACTCIIVMKQALSLTHTHSHTPCPSTVDSCCLLPFFMPVSCAFLSS